MASLIYLFLFLCLVLSFSLSSALNNHQPSPHILQACKATRFPQQCLALTSIYDPTPLQIIQTAISFSLHNQETADSMVRSILDASSGNHSSFTAAKTCLQVLRNSRYRTNLTATALPRGAVKDARAWMSAALTYQYACWAGLKNSIDSALYAQTISFLDSLTMITSNALSMIVSYDRYGNDTVSWRPPLTERDGFWETSGSSGLDSGSGFGLPAELTPNVTVCKNGGDGCYATVQEAVNAAPDYVNVGEGRFVIYIKEGVYEERVRVPLRKRNVVFLGDGIGKTVITGSANVGQPGMTTYHSATVGVLGDGFMAKNLTIQNTAGANAYQAVAFRSDSDHSVIENCEFLGNQDTLYAHTLRQFYKSCRIVGNVDFIFGNSATIFQDCQILVRPREYMPEMGEDNAITAQGRTDPAQSTGFVFHSCLINGTDKYIELYYRNAKVHRNYLGRPWKEYSRTIFIRSFLGDLIRPEGWMPWTGDFGLGTLYYGEFGNSGPGSSLTRRVPWSTKVPDEHVLAYSVQSFIQGNDWIPSSQ